MLKIKRYESVCVSMQLKHDDLPIKTKQNNTKMLLIRYQFLFLLFTNNQSKKQNEKKKTQNKATIQIGISAC